MYRNRLRPRPRTSPAGSHLATGTGPPRPPALPPSLSLLADPDVFERITDAFFALDREWRFTYFNSRAAATLRRTREEVLDKPVWDVFPQIRGTEFEHRFRRAFDEQKPDQFEAVYAGLGHWLEVNVYPGPQGISVFFHDVTDRHAAREALNRLAAIIESSDDAIIGKDLEGTITSWNAGAEHLYGYTPEEAIGRSITMLLPPNNKQEFEQIMARLKRGERVEPYDTIRVKYDGTPVHVSVTVSPIRDDTGRVTGASAIARDITERKQMDQRKDRFLNLVAHELRTPITIMKSAVQLLIRANQRLEGTSLEHRYLGLLNDQIERMTRLITDMVEVTTLDRGHYSRERSTFDLCEVVSDAVRPLEVVHPGLTFVVDAGADDGGCLVSGDRARIQQAVGNILANAVQHSPRDGTIRASLTVAGREVVLKVSDDGMGIPPHEHNRVFEQFYQVANSPAKGLGLGLYIARQIVEGHGGRIWVRSDPRRAPGATFFLSLPRAIESAGTRAPSSAEQAPEPSSTLAS